MHGRQIQILRATGVKGTPVEPGDVLTVGEEIDVADANILLNYKRAKLIELEPEPVPEDTAPEPDTLLDLLHGNIASVKEVLPVLSVADLLALKGAEEEADAPRKGVISAIDAELAERGPEDTAPEPEPEDTAMEPDAE